MKVSTRPRCSIDSWPDLEPERVRLKTKGIDRGRREKGEAIPAGLDGPRPLEQAMDQNDIRSGQLVATGDATSDEGPVVDEHLQVEPRSQTTRVAVATGGLVDAA